MSVDFDEDEGFGVWVVVADDEPASGLAAADVVGADVGLVEAAEVEVPVESEGFRGGVFGRHRCDLAGKPLLRSASVALTEPCPEAVNEPEGRQGCHSGLLGVGQGDFDHGRVPACVSRARASASRRWALRWSPLALASLA
jgi:hypothetical protein